MIRNPGINTVGVSNLGNVVGTTGQVSGPFLSYAFAGGNNITLSQSINGVSGTVTISAFNQTLSPEGTQSFAMNTSTAGGGTGGTSGSVTGTGVQYVFHAGSNITLSQSINASSGSLTIYAGAGGAAGSNTLGMSNLSNTAGTSGTLTISGPNTAAQSVQPVAMSGSNASAAFSTATFGNLNGMSFYLTNGSMVGSYTVPTQSAQPVAISGSNASLAFSTATFGNSNGLSFYLTNNSMVGSYTVPTQSTQPVAISGSNASLAFSTATFGNSNGMSFYLTNNSMVGSYTVPTQSVQPVAISGSNASLAFSTATFGNSNGLSFYLTNNSMVGSYTVPTQSVQPEGTISIAMNTSTAGGGTGGTSGSITGTGIQYVFHAGSNITLSQSTNGASGSMSIYGPSPGGGATLSMYEPYYLANPVSTTYAPRISTWYFQPFVAPQAIASGRINNLWSFSNSNAGIMRATSAGSIFATNTTGGRSASYTQGHQMALYSRGAGANSTQLESFWSTQWSIGLSQSVGVSLTNATQVTAAVTGSVTYIATIGSNGATTMGNFASNAGLSTAASSVCTSLWSSVFASIINMVSGMALIPHPLSTSFGPGAYWLAQAWMSSFTTAGTSIQDLLPVVNQVGIYGISSMPHRLIGLTVSNTSSQYFPGAGMYSAQSAVPPPTVQFTQIRSIASHVTQYFNFMNISCGV